MNTALKHVLIMSATAFITVGTVIANVDNAVDINDATFQTSSELSSNEQTLDNNTLVFLKNNSNSYSNNNISKSIAGPNFKDIDNNWKDSYEFTLYNQGDKDITVISKANYVEDPDGLRDDIFVALHNWNDKNDNGKFDDSELGEQLEYNSILRWRNDTFNLGNLESKSANKYVLVFDGSGITDANLDKKAIYSFRFYPLVE